MTPASDGSPVDPNAPVTIVAGPEDEKARLQRRIDEARESISQTVGEIKGTVEDQYATAKEAISGLVDWRDKFQHEPIVWSIGALSAGFALGYTLGYAKRKGTLGRKHSAVGAFADTLVQEIAALHDHLPLATLDPTIKRVLGFDLSQLFAEMRTSKKRERQSSAARPGVRKRKRKRSLESTSVRAKRRKR